MPVCVLQGNSEVVHAVATDPEGPYMYQSTVMPHFAHGPTISADGKGGYVLAVLGCGRPFVPFVHGCHNGSTPPAPPAPPSDVAPACTQFDIGVLTAKSLDGPWSERRKIVLSGGDTPPAESWFRQGGSGEKGNGFCNPYPAGAA